jgi:hypothetical protein
MTSLTYNYLQQIFNAMPNTLTPTCFTIPSRIDSAITICVVSSKNIENNILNDTNLNAEEKVSLLCAASVARHSYTYWVSVWGDANDTWWNFTNGYKETPDGPSQTAKDDVDGLIGGAVTGGLLGGAAGGILGGIAVYMSSSIISIGKQSGYWFW